MKFILKTVKDKIGIITFNNESKRNALCDEMLGEISDTLDDFAKNDIRVVILRSSFEAKVWSAGLNINNLPEPGKDPLPYSHPLEKLMRKIESFKAPVIAMITGSVWGGAFDLALTCDMIIGTPDSSFAITPAKIGVPYNASGLLHFLNSVEMNIAKEMFFTATPIDAQKAYNLGVINHIIDLNSIEQFTIDIATKITYNSPLSIGVIKEQINLLGKTKPINPSVFEKINELRTQAYSSYDYKEGKKAFLEKRKPIFKGE